MDIGNKIQAIRTESGMTQAEFAEKFNVTRQSVSNWENNKHYPDLDTLCKISDEYNVSFDILLKEDREYVSHRDTFSRCRQTYHYSHQSYNLRADTAYQQRHPTVL